MWKNNRLSIVVFALFAVTLVGHSVAGWKAHNEKEQQHGNPRMTYGEFVTSAEFGETVSENWESEFFQMGFYVILTVFLFQKGSAESKKFDGTDECDADPKVHGRNKTAPMPVRKGGWMLALYRNSLSLAFLGLFLISFVWHGASGARKYNEEQLEHGSGETVGTIGYMGTAQFWYESLQNWQSEFLAVFAIVVFSIWLRQWGSPESKPVHAAHEETGGG